MNWLRMAMLQQPSTVKTMAAAGAMFLPALAIPFYFFYLFYYSDETRNWRLAYIALAMPPFVMIAAAMILFYATHARAGSQVGALSYFALVHLTGAAVTALGISAAMADDCRQRRGRHWTHWLAAGLMLVSTLAAGAVMFGMWLAPPAHP